MSGRGSEVGLELGARFDSLQQEVYLHLWRAYDRLKVLEDGLFRRYGLSSQQYNVLRLLAIRAPAGLPTLELADRLISRAPDITRMLDKLEHRGLIRRTRLAANRRVVEVQISVAGQQLLAAIGPQLRDCHQEQLGHLTRDQLHQLRDLLIAARAPHEMPGSPWSESARMTDHS
jgi:DNA-binding MarR family transcriptional regulator